MESIKLLIGEIVRREKGLVHSGMKSPPGDWFAPSDGNRTRLFLGNEKHSFLAISLRVEGRAQVRLPGGFELLTAVILSAMMVPGTRVDILRTHEHFDGITLAPDGKHLSLDYYDYPEPNAQRFFHYVFSLHSSPKLITGRSPISVDAELELAYEDIPQDVIHDACSWLESNIATAHTQQRKPILQILTNYRVLLERHRPSLP